MYRYIHKEVKGFIYNLKVQKQLPILSTISRARPTVKPGSDTN
jgi:hypothetical protein